MIRSKSGFYRLNIHFSYPLFDVLLRVHFKGGIDCLGGSGTTYLTCVGRMPYKGRCM